MWVLGHTANVKTTTKMVVMQIMLVLCSGNIYNAQYMWVVHLLESRTNLEQAQAS